MQNMALTISALN